jgi:hypothetical protein
MSQYSRRWFCALPGSVHGRISEFRDAYKGPLGLPVPLPLSTSRDSKNLGGKKTCGGRNNVSTLSLKVTRRVSPQAPHPQSSGAQKLRVRAELFLSEPSRSYSRTYVGYSTFRRRKKAPAWEHICLVGDRAFRGSLHASVGPTAQRVGGHVWGTKAKPLAPCRRRLCCLSKQRKRDPALFNSLASVRYSPERAAIKPRYIC